MSKWTCVLSCTLTMVAFSESAHSGIYEFETEKEAHEFVLDLAQTLSLEEYWSGGGGYGPESCTFYRPECYAVSVQHCNGSCSWTVVTDIEWNSDDEIYEICIGETFEDVDGIKAYWKTTQSDACDYCDNGTGGDPNPDWDPNYWDMDEQDPEWADMTSQDDCQEIAWPSNDIVYWGRQLGDIGDWDYDTGKFARWDGKMQSGAAYNSRVDLVSCPE